MDLKIHDVELTNLKIISGENGDVFHAIKSSDSAFNGFGEAYFSSVHKGAIKGWKRHRVMICNLIVPVGTVRFVLRDERDGSPTEGKQDTIELSMLNYCRLTIPPGIWFSFEGIGESVNLILNIASIEHSPDESETDPIERLS